MDYDEHKYFLNGVELIKHFAKVSGFCGLR
jgi:hypothetical protein